MGFTSCNEARSPTPWNDLILPHLTPGYLVTTPNLIGHWSRVTTDSHLSSVVEDLRPYFTGKYDLIIGHSLGAITTLELFQHLPHPTAFILVDPPLQLTPEQVDYYDNTFTDTVERVKEAEAYSTENPLWSREDCIMRELATRLCPVEAVRGILRQNNPWYFIDNFNVIWSQWRVTVLIADPAKFKVCSVYDVKPSPQIRPAVVPGAGHWIQSDFPEVVVEEALKTVGEVERCLISSGKNP